MNIESRFIINRNNICYMYVEKYLIDNETLYNVYYDSKLFTLSSDSFHSIYANDKKISLFDFLIFVETSVVSNIYERDKYYFLYEKADKLLSEIDGKDRKNPLFKHNYEFLDLLDIFNDFIYNSNILNLDNEIDYEEEYQRLIKQEF